MSFHKGNSLTADEAKAAMKEMLHAFECDENSARLNEARDNAGNDMLKNMQLVFPLTTQIQMEIVQKYGFTGDGEGVIRFIQKVKLLQKHDSSVGDLYEQLRTVVIPQMTPSVPNVS